MFWISKHPYIRTKKITTFMEYRDGAKLALENATALLDVAANSAQLNHFGIASSLTILSAEEAIKALVCLRRAFYPSVKIEDFEMVFKDHKIKHKHIIDGLDFTQKMIKKTITVVPIIREFIEKIGAESEENNPGISKQLQDILDYMDLISRDPKSFASIEIASWWKNANKEKNNGLYVGKNDPHWHNPADTTEQFYSQGKKYATMLTEHITFFFGLQVMFEIIGIDIKL